MIPMPSYSKNEVVLVHYPFSDLSTTKVRPAVNGSRAACVARQSHRAADKSNNRFARGRIYSERLGFGRTASSNRRQKGIYTIHSRLVVKSLGQLSPRDAQKLDDSLRTWLGL